MTTAARPKMKASADTQAGMTLVEVLVTLVLVSVGLLGVAALQLTTLRNNQESYVRSQASVLAGYILDRMRANQAGFLNGQYDIGLDGLSATPTSTAGRDIARWQADIDRLLPGGAANVGGSIVRTGQNIVTITIRWGERADNTLGTGADFTTFQTRTEI